MILSSNTRPKTLWHRLMRWIPIRSLGPRHRERIAHHLKLLNTTDRYLRFGFHATDEQIERYVAGLNFERDDIYGVFNRRLELLAVAHMAFSVDPQWACCAEFGVSVDAHMRGRGLGGRLFKRVVVHARNEGVGLLFIHALTENTAMLKIARNAGARIEREGGESDAYLSLPEANLDSQFSELVDDSLADVDFHLKTRAKQFMAALKMMQDVRRGVQLGRHQSAE